MIVSLCGSKGHLVLLTEEGLLLRLLSSIVIVLTQLWMCMTEDLVAWPDGFLLALCSSFFMISLKV